MKIEQIYTPCLAAAAYYIECNGEAAVVDPMRDIEPYLELAEKNGAKIKYIFVTHFHADFVSGHLDLARRTGATIVFGPNASTDYPKHDATDGEIFRIGNLTVKTLHTPGHTPESTCFLLHLQTGEPYCVFTGDTLFIGDVGRPDLVQTEESSTQEDMAGMLYESLHDKLLPLPDDVVVYPAHGQGSACGRNISSERFSTIGVQKTANAAFTIKNKSGFIATITTARDPAPSYFSRNAALNRNECDDLQVIKERARQRLNPADVKLAVEQGAQLLDIRSPAEFADGHIPGSINIGIDGMFAVWAGTLIEDAGQPLIIVGIEARVDEAIIRLARVGFHNVIGFLDGGLRSWALSKNSVDQIEQIDAEQFAKIYDGRALNTLDCRTPIEFGAMHVDRAILFPLNTINENLRALDRSGVYYIHCKSGYRSSSAASILRKHGVEHVVNIHDGFDGLLNTSIPKSSSPPVAD